jgi:hypothetical protein
LVYNTQHISSPVHCTLVYNTQHITGLLMWCVLYTNM